MQHHKEDITGIYNITWMISTVYVYESHKILNINNNFFIQVGFLTVKDLNRSNFDIKRLVEILHDSMVIPTRVLLSLCP